MRILVTGVSGRVGRAIVVRLMHAGHTVIGLDRAPSSIVHLLGDLDTLAHDGQLAQALAGVQAVVHTAALHAPQVGVVDEAEFWRINLAATQRLWQLAVQAGVGRFVFTSTTALYGAAATPEGRAGWLTEATVPQPRTIYHRSKLAAEQWLTEAAADLGGSGTPEAPVLRILRMSRCFPEPAPLMALWRLCRGVDARDVAQAHELALADAGPAVALFNISAPTPFTPDDAPALWHDAPALLARRAPALVAAFAQRGWPLPARIDRVVDAGLAAQQLGWVAQRGWPQLLAQLDDDSPEVLPVQR